MQPPIEKEATPTEELAVAPPANSASLLRLLFDRLERVWHTEGGRRASPPEEERPLAIAPYRPRHYLRRRMPDEIEAVLATLNQEALDLIRGSFSYHALNLSQFAEAIVRTGNYDADHVLAFVGGVVDLFLEVLRSQADRVDEGAPALTVNWAQLMNHFIECPEIAMFEGSEGGGVVTKQAGSIDRIPQVHKNAFVDRAKHYGACIEKIYWCPYLDTLTTVEGTRSVYFWSPHAPGWDAPRTLTPQLGQDFYDSEGSALYTVLAAGWDDELQDLVALLSNRMLIVWRLRNREKGQFQQKRELRFHASRSQGRGGAEYWKVKLLIVDPQNGEDVNQKKRPEDQERSEDFMRREKHETRLAEEASTQLDIWWNSYMKTWVTTDRSGKLFLWDLRQMEGTFLEPFVEPKKVLMGHKRHVTSYLDINKNKFTTTSLDRSVILWDIKSLNMEMKIEGAGCHTGAVLSQAYLPRFNMLVTVGTEKKVFVWTVDNTAFRGNKAKLSGHQANLTQVSAGQRVFFTLDEACVAILWDGATLASLQTVGLSTMVPKHCLCLPEHGTICLAGRRLNFLEGNEIAAAALGKALTKEQQAKMTNKQDDLASLKEKAAPVWCGMSNARGAIISTTEVEVRLHTRGSPGESRVIFNTPEGDSITAFSAIDNSSLAVIGTSKGALYFIKERSGFVLKMYPGKSGDAEDWQRGGGPNSGEAGSVDDSKPPSREKRSLARGRSSVGAGSFGGGTQGQRGAASPTSGNVSPQGGNAPGGSDGAIEDSMPADGGLEQGHRETRRARNAGPAQNCPTPEEMARGVSRQITCILPSEAQQRIYAGTVEGRILIFKCEDGFPITRWLYTPGDTSAVMCLDCGQETGGISKLLTVGMQDGTVHLYTISNLRPAGSIHIPQLLKEGDGNASRGAELRHLRLFSVRAEAGLPLTLMTVDAASRLRLWGIDIHEQSGKLNSLKLIADGGQLRESDSVQVQTKDLVPKAAPPPVKEAKKEEGAGGKDEGQAEAKPLSSPPVPSTIPLSLLMQRETSASPVELSAIATMTGIVSLPINALVKQTEDGPVPASTKERLSAKLAANKGADADPKRKAAEAAEAVEREAQKHSKHKGKNRATSSSSGAGVFSMTQPPGSQEASRAGARVAFDATLAAVQGEISEGSGTDTDADVDEAVGWRLDQHPREPKKNKDGAKPEKEEPAPRLVDGSRLAWFGDSGGWIWCVDIGASVVGAVEKSPPISVILDPAAARQQSKAPAASRPGRRITIRTNTSTAMLSSKGQAQSDEHIQVLAKPAPKARPETFKIVNAWPAHQSAIVSLSSATSPAALVSIDADKEVKVWSTAGDLWGHFSLKGGLDGNEHPVAVWPPPHALAAQLSLMSTAKGLCKRMGFQTTKEAEEQKEVVLPKHMRRTPSTLAMAKAKSRSLSSTAPASVFTAGANPEDTATSSELAATASPDALQAARERRLG
eukprot:CAMPEP_0195128218 /NCGR_PEP_ID=MMETSP0448-20130528/138705_1 /TAXON_ID=66468 /ORGANISM="Heterocapsa triquestra, Strain CCMP 448" /LENGTH=1457 /DNA_ID=CAMNT_0040166005 /DNA_START=121 /DNA_END=4491 /DNA_ORIENTATION=+